MATAMIWCWHLVVLWHARALLREWWHGRPGSDYEHGVPGGRARTAVLAAVLVPIISWFWLYPTVSVYRRRTRLAEALRARRAEEDQHAADVMFWRGRLDEGQPVEQDVARQLLELWGANVAPDVKTPALPFAQPTRFLDGRRRAAAPLRRSPYIVRGRT